MNFFKKWYTYQKERFPVLVYGLYIFCIVFAVFSFCNYEVKMYHNSLVFIQEAEELVINYYNLIPMFITAFLQFLIIRIIDEFKDYDEDCKYRPYRPVPRGLVTLKELKILFIICMAVQAIITIFINFQSFFWLCILWIFFFIMSKGFFIKKFLDKHLLFEVFLDELLIVFLGLYLASYIYIDKNIWIILAVLYIVSWIVEIARKIRAKEDEEEGVKTYTAVLGISKTVLILFILETLLMIFEVQILFDFRKIFLIFYFLINVINVLFSQKRTKKYAKMTELSANIYIIITYLSFGLLII